MEFKDWEECLSAVRACINYAGAYADKAMSDSNALTDSKLVLEDLESAESLMEDLASYENRGKK